LNFEIEDSKNYSSSIERNIAIAAIVSKEFLLGIKNVYKKEMIRVDFIKDILNWCFEYLNECDDSPKNHIKDIYNSKIKLLDDDRIEQIEKFLSSISDEYSRENEFNYKYVLGKAEKYFRYNNLIALKEEIEKLTNLDKLDDAENKVNQFMKLSIDDKSSGVNPFTDSQAVIKAFRNESMERIFSFSGDLGKIMGSFSRGRLISFIGNPGIGKTWWLLYVANRAYLSGFNVVFASFEMTEAEIIRRMFQTLLGRPSFSHRRETNVKVDVPLLDCEYNQNDSCNKSERVCQIGIYNKGSKVPFEMLDKKIKDKYVPCTACLFTQEYSFATYKKTKNIREMNEGQALKEMKKVQETVRGNRFKLLEFPNNSLPISDFRAKLQNFEYYDGFVPDIVITDYADKFLLQNNRGEYRHQLKSVWEGHKAIAQEKNCVVVTASQTNVARSKGKDVSQGDWAESIAKEELIDLGISINQTPEEKRNGYCRLGKIKDRHSEFSLMSEVFVIQCLGLGLPYIDSFCKDVFRGE